MGEGSRFGPNMKGGVIVSKIQRFGQNLRRGGGSFLHSKHHVDAICGELQ